MALGRLAEAAGLTVERAVAAATQLELLRLARAEGAGYRRTGP